jgi:hypothetical protein
LRTHDHVVFLVPGIGTGIHRVASFESHQLNRNGAKIGPNRTKNNGAEHGSA